MAGYFDFAGAIERAADRLAYLRERLKWTSAKLKKVMGIGKAQLKREIKDEEDWLSWLKENAPMI